MQHFLPHCDKCGVVVKTTPEPFRCGECETRDEAGNLIERIEWCEDMYVTFDCPNCGPRRMLHVWPPVVPEDRSGQ